MTDWGWRDYWPDQRRHHVWPWWVRVDEYRGPPPTAQHLAVLVIEPAHWVRTDGRTARTEAEANEIDRADPLPVPPPRCGQVWRFKVGDWCVSRVDNPEGQPATHFQGVRIKAPRLAMLGSSLVDTDSRWPIPGGVLIAGPGAPWARPEDVGL